MGYERGNKSTVQIWQTGQITITVPRAIAEAMSLEKGDELGWFFEDGKVELRKIEREKENKKKQS